MTDNDLIRAMYSLKFILYFLWMNQVLAATAIFSLLFFSVQRHNVPVSLCFTSCIFYFYYLVAWKRQAASSSDWPSACEATTLSGRCQNFPPKIILTESSLLASTTTIPSLLLVRHHRYDDDVTVCLFVQHRLPASPDRSRFSTLLLHTFYFIILFFLTWLSMLFRG